MRNPKFRGICKETNNYVYGFGWYETDYTDEYLEELGQLNQDAVLFTDSSPVLCHIDSMGQYTGLKDKNGRDIYEGDIVKVESHKVYPFDNYRKSKSVSAKYYRIGWHKNGSWNKFDGLSDEHIGLVGVYKPEIWCEVIGNIYKNPELLER